MPQKEVRLLLGRGGGLDARKTTDQCSSYLDDPWAMLMYPGGDSYMPDNEMGYTVFKLLKPFFLWSFIRSSGEPVCQLQWASMILCFTNKARRLEEVQRLPPGHQPYLEGPEPEPEPMLFLSNGKLAAGRLRWIHWTASTAAFLEMDLLRAKKGSGSTTC